MEENKENKCPGYFDPDAPIDDGLEFLPKLNAGSLDLPNRNGVVYTRQAMEDAVNGALIAVENCRPSKLFPDGKIPNFEQFLRMIAPNLSEEKIRLMVEMSERMPDYPDIVARHQHGQELFDRLQARVRDGGAHARNLLLVGQPRVGNWEKELAEFGIGSKEADAEIMIEPRMCGDQVISYDIVKGRKGHPDAINVGIDSLPGWLRNVNLPLDPIDNCAPHVRTLTIPEPSFGSSRGCRSLLNTFGSRRQVVNGEISVNGKQRKELVTNAKGTMVFPRAKQKFGRR